MALKLNQGAVVTVAVAGTAVQLTSTVNAANVLYVEGDKNCPAFLYIGNSTVSATAYIAAIRAREGWTISVQGEPKLDLTAIYVNADTAGSKLRWGWA